MSKPKAAVALLDKAISLPGAGVTRTALLINPRATDKEVAELGAALVQIEGSRSWWLGDFGLFLQGRKRAELLKMGEDAEMATDKGKQYVDDKAEALGIDAGTWHSYVAVSRYYEVCIRMETLSFSHHRAVMENIGVDADPKRAVEWLQKAEAGNWSVSTLRQKIKEKQATAQQPSKDPLPNAWQPIDDADDWALGVKLDFTPEQARSHLVRLTNIIALIDKLKELAK